MKQGRERERGRERAREWGRAREMGWGRRKRSEFIDDSLRSSNANQSVIGLRVMPPLSMQNDLARSRRSNAAGDVQHIKVRDSATQRSES